MMIDHDHNHDQPWHSDSGNAWLHTGVSNGRLEVFAQGLSISTLVLLWRSLGLYKGVKSKQEHTLSYFQTHLSPACYGKTEANLSWLWEKNEVDPEQVPDPSKG